MAVLDPISSLGSKSGLVARVLAMAMLVFAVACGPQSAEEKEGESLTQGIEAHNAGKIDEATRDYFETLKQNPSNKYAWYNLGQIARTSARWTAAEAYYRLALEDDADFGPALFGLAYVRSAVGATQEAIDLYRRAAQSEPDNATAHYNLGLLLRDTGRVAEGDAEIARGLALNPQVGPRPSLAPQPSGR